MFNPDSAFEMLKMAAGFLEPEAKLETAAKCRELATFLEHAAAVEQGRPPPAPASVSPLRPVVKTEGR